MKKNVLNNNLLNKDDALALLALFAARGVDVYGVRSFESDYKAKLINRNTINVDSFSDPILYQKFKEFIVESPIDTRFYISYNDFQIEDESILKLNIQTTPYDKSLIDLENNVKEITDIPFELHGGLRLYNKVNAIEIVKAIRRNGYILHGVDGLWRIGDVGIQPDNGFDFIPSDTSNSDDSCKETIQFIAECPEVMWFDVVYDVNKTVSS